MVSIVLATYNWSKYIMESIDSVLSQSYTNFELIIVNDCSVDTTEDIILNYKNKDSRIIYIKNTHNIWLTKSLNKWIVNSCAKYITRIDDDDIWLSTDKLKTQIDFMETNLAYALCGTSVVMIDEQGSFIREVSYRRTDLAIRNVLLRANQFAHSSIIMRRSALNILWFYNENILVAQDYELWLRLGTKYKFYNLPDFYTAIRVRTQSISRTKWWKQRKNSFKIMFIYLSYYPNKISCFLVQLMVLLLPTTLIAVLLKINSNLKKESI